MPSQGTRGGRAEKLSPPDLVYVYRHTSDDGELRHSLRSLRNVRFRRLWIVGERPPWLAGDVTHVARRNSFGDRYRNTLEHVRAIAKMDDVADRFVLFNDDFFVLEPLDEIPIWHRGPIAEAHSRRPKGSRGAAGGSPWHQGIWTAEQLVTEAGISPALSYELHVPLPIDRRRWTEIMEPILERVNPATPLQHRSIYGNLAQIGGELLRRDPKVHTLSNEVPHPDGPPVISTSNKSFARGAIGGWLRNRFPDPSPWEGDLV